MAKLLNKNKILSLAAISVIVASYAGVKLVNSYIADKTNMPLVMALVMTALLGVVCLLLYKCKSNFMGLLASIIGYKMMPVDIPNLSTASLNAGMLYFIVQKVAVVIFVIFIINFYKKQDSYEKIKILPILALMFAATFANSISSQTYSYFIAETGSMLGYYLACFICFILAAVTILLVSYTSNYDSMRFAAYFEFVAMGIHILRRVGTVAVLIAGSNHVSKSYYCWIAIYVAVIVMFYVAKEQKKKSLKA